MGRRRPPKWPNEPGKKEFYDALSPIIARVLNYHMHRIASGKRPAVLHISYGSGPYDVHEHLQRYSDPVAFADGIVAFERLRVREFNPLPTLIRGFRGSLNLSFQEVSGGSSDSDQELQEAQQFWQEHCGALLEAYIEYKSPSKGPFKSSKKPAASDATMRVLQGLNTGASFALFNAYSRSIPEDQRDGQALRRLAGVHLLGLNTLERQLGFSARGDDFNRLERRSASDVELLFSPRTSSRMLQSYGRGEALGCPVLRSVDASREWSTTILARLGKKAFEDFLEPHLFAIRDDLDPKFYAGASNRIRAIMDGKSAASPANTYKGAVGGCPHARVSSQES